MNSGCVFTYATTGSSRQNKVAVDIRLCPRCCPLVSHFEPVHITYPHDVKCDVIDKTEEDRAMATNNMHRQFCEILTWFLRYATDRQIGTLIAVLCTPTTNDVINNLLQ